MSHAEPSVESATRRGIAAIAGYIALLAVLMFPLAGWRWIEGWAFLAVFNLELFAASLYLKRTNPEIFIARSKIHAGTKAWDKVMLCFVIGSFIAMFPLAGFEARDGEPYAPAWVVAAGYVLLTLGVLGTTWVLGVNKFAEPSVRIQTDRAHQVVDRRPYAIVRHPMNVAAFLLYVGIPLTLRSYWGLIATAVGVAALVVRTVFEDRTLREELVGYEAYAQRVRYRLMPGVW